MNEKGLVMRIIGVTGGIGGGKSALLEKVRDSYKCKVINSDEVAHLLKEPGGACYRPIVGLLGEGVLDEDGFIDRVKMAEMIFGNSELLAKVNGIIHPAVKEYITGSIEEERRKGLLDFLFIEAALLIEDGYVSIVDELWYVFASPEVRQRRLIEERGYSEEKAVRIIESQLSDSEFRDKCQVVIDNNDDIEAAVLQVERGLKNSIKQ